ncbi:hypothetical protein BC834DRAFT_970401 [Gloeopeniophorella convolvens]|nr:hypothetical protein BC834DRAFT_970401 [Gloeopeniophorella convolvens]
MPVAEPSSAEYYRSLFIQASDNYKKKTGRDPAAHCALVTQLSKCTSPEEVTALLQNGADRLDVTHRSRSRTRMFEKFAPIVEVIRPLCDTAGKATGLVFQPAETIFGSIGVLLTIPDNYIKNHEAFMGLLEQMAHFLGRLGMLIVPEDVRFDDAMTKIIVDILIELIGAFALLAERMSPSGAFIPMAKRRFRKFLAMVSGDKEVESMLKRLDELTKVEHLMATAQTRHSITIVEREQRRQGRMQQAERYRSWLSVPNSSTNQANASEARYSDTSMWLVRGEVYEAWKSSGALLWITGKPGAGKTVICSTVIKNLQDSLRSSKPSASLAYFYSDFRDTKKQSYRSLLGSLLMDLSTQSDESDKLLRDLFSKCEDGSQEPDADDLIQCLKDMLARSDGIKYIVVDALDEMPNYSVSSSRAKSLELVSNLMGLGHSDLRICITSRPEDDIGQVLRPLTYRQVVTDQEKGHRDDIARLIRSVVGSNRRMQVWGEALKEEVIEALSEKADGMFRYVSCQLDTLCECPPPKIRPTLKSLPTTLHATYEATLERISEEKWDYAHRLFQCLSISTRPLRVEELAEVLAVSLDGEVPTYHNDWRSEDPESVVLSTCPGNFIQVISGGQWRGRTQRIVQFTHFSVKEFLTSGQLSRSKANVSRFYVLPGPSHAVLAKTCLGILLRPNDAPAVEQGTSTEPHLVDYAVHFWDEHARSEDVSMSLLKAMGLLFDPTKPHFAAWARSREPDQHRPGTPLYFAALCDLPPIVEHILASGSQDISARGGKHGTAFFAALEVESPTVTRLLLDHGADINAQYGYYIGTALQTVAARGALVIAQLLLDRGADVNAQGGYNGTALQVAAANGQLDIIQLLLDRGADINAQGGYYGTALQAAAASVGPVVVQLLLDRGAYVDARGGYHGTALQAAAARNRLDIIQLLLDRGADVNIQGEKNPGIVLHAAAACSQLNVVQLLLNHGADIDAQGGLYGNVLQAAACKRGGETDNVQFFLGRGFDINAQGGKYGTALIGASYYGNLDIVQLLLACGADTRIKSEEHGTALEAARTPNPFSAVGDPERAAIVELLSSVPQDASVVPPNGGAGSSTW